MITLIQGVLQIVTLVLTWYIGQNVREVHLAVNSKMDKLLQTTGEAEKAKGVIEGKQSKTAKVIISDVEVKDHASKSK